MLAIYQNGVIKVKKIFQALVAQLVRAQVCGS